jgi:hypothetical protein
MQSTSLPHPGFPTSLKRTLLVVLFFLMGTGLLAYGIRVAMHGITTGADYFIYYVAGHESFLHGANPYSEELVKQTQIGIYGTLAPPGSDQMIYVYPAYTLFIVFPFILFNFPDSQALWVAFNLLLWILVPIILFPKAPRWMIVTLLFFYPLTFGLIVGNFDVPTGIILMLFISLFVIREERSKGLQILTGLLLAWASSKPQFAWAFFILAFWVVLKHKLWPLAISFITTLIVLITTSLLLFPSWPTDWLARTRAYTSYILPASPITLFLRYLMPNDMAALLSTGLTIMGLIFTAYIFLGWWRRKNSATDQIRLLAWLGYFTYITHLFPKSCEQIILMIPFFIWSVLEYQHQKIAVILFWISGLAVSWFAFFIDPLKLTANGIYEWPVLFFTIWLAYVWFARPVLPIPKIPAYGAQGE